jgi:hypothetical protein
MGSVALRTCLKMINDEVPLRSSLLGTSDKKCANIHRLPGLDVK